MSAASGEHRVAGQRPQPGDTHGQKNSQGLTCRIVIPRLSTILRRVVLAFVCLCFSVVVASAQFVAYPKIEAAFNLGGTVADPYDFTNLDLRVQIAQPDGSTISLPAFFDGGTTWRVRHTPMTNGLFTITGITSNGLPAAYSNLQPANWIVAGSPYSAGYVKLDPTNNRRFLTSNGRRHFPIGHNVAWWATNANTGASYVGVFAKMGAAGENWSRVWMDHFYETKNLEWPKVGNFGTYDLNVARRWDTIVTGAEQGGIAFQMTIQHHGQYASTNGSNVNPNWEQNPYWTTNGGFMSSASQFFTNATAKALTKRKLRYIIARWGYSPSIMAWELFNEVQFTDAAYANQWANIIAWHNEMAAFMKSQDPWQHLVTTSSQMDQPMWGQCDYYQHHDYPNDLIAGLRDAADVPLGQPVKPVFGGENGMDATFFWGAHAPLWSGLMAGQSGFSQQWFWDRIEAEKSYSLFRPAALFSRAAGIGDQTNFIRSSPVTTCPIINALVFSPGGGFIAAAQDTFTVGGSAPDGIGALPSFLQGNFHRALTPNGYTFLVNYPVAGTFAVAVTTVASSGAGLAIIVDGVTNSLAAFPSAGADYATNYVGTVNLSVGAHTVKLWNPGLDWVVLGNITLNPYAPQLAAYQIGNTNFAALWLWHRTNIYVANPSTSLTGTVAVAGLNPGTYSAKWWDTVSGATVSNFTFNVVSTSTPATLNVPAVSRSLALFAGLPPQANLSSPNLTRTVEPNSAPLIIPLTITNNGGLPLAYSLSFTGLNATAWASLNSTQAAGPYYSFKDISVVGTDLTASFTQLASPKTAKDEGRAGPYAIGFDFPFFSGAQSPGTYSNLYVSPNGFISFTAFTGDTSTNLAFPVATNSAPSNCVAWFWDDLDLSTAGKVYVLSEPSQGNCTVQFQNVLVKGTSATVSGQIILKTTGEILLTYQGLGRTNTCTVGVQNAARNSGFTVVHNANYLQSFFAVRLTPAAWCSATAVAGYVPKSSRETINFTLDPTAVPPGSYSATLLVNTPDAAPFVTAFPVSLNILGSPTALVATSNLWNMVVLAWQDNATTETGFELERKPGTNGTFSALASVGANVASFTDTNVISRTTYGYRVRSTNTFGVSAWSNELLLTTPLSPIEQWRQTYFGSPDNLGNAADGADWDGDGQLNILEYAFNTNPTNTSASPISYNLVADHFTVTFQRTRPAPGDITYLYEVTGDLTTGVWNSGPAYTTQSITDNLNGTETVVVQVNATVSASPAQFVRVRISRP